MKLHRIHNKIAAKLACLPVGRSSRGSQPLQVMSKIQTVKDYINHQKSPQKEICIKLCNMILKAFPKIEEKMWIGVPWYANKAYVVALKDHVNLGVCIKGLTKNELAVLEGTGKIMRHIKIRNIKDIKEENIVRLLKKIM